MEVVADLVAVGGDLRGQVGMAGDALTDEEESRLGVVGAQYVQQVRCRCSIRSVVDGQGDPGVVGSRRRRRVASR